MEPTKARIRPIRKLMSETMPSALAPASWMLSSRSTRRKRARPTAARASASDASPTKVIISSAPDPTAMAARPTRSRKGGAATRRFVSRSGTAAARSRSLRTPSGSPERSTVIPRAVPASTSLRTKTRNPESHAVTSRASNPRRLGGGRSPHSASTRAGGGGPSCIRHEPERRRTMPSGTDSRLHRQGVVSLLLVVTAAMRTLGYHRRSRGVEARPAVCLRSDMERTTGEVVICGAGIAGVAAAYHLAVRRGVRDVVLVDERPPLTLTSDKSAECYRNWWPGPGDDMVAVMNRSIDLLEELAGESGNVFRLNRRGYLFATAEPARAALFAKAADEAADLGAGPVRRHATGTSDYRPSAADGFDPALRGTDVITEPSLIRRHYPWLADDTIALLHARRCGWFSGQQLGMYLLERARASGVRLLEGRVERIDTAGGRVRGVDVRGPGGTKTIGTERAVLAAGPYLKDAGRLVGV